MVYDNSLNGEMVFDDFHAVRDNDDVDATKTHWTELFSNNYWGTNLKRIDVEHNSYRPLTILTFRWNHSFHGMEVFGFHLVNVILHACASMLFVLIVRQLLPNAAFTTLLLSGMAFATHPIHTDAVSSIVGRAEPLSAMFAMVSFLVYAASVNKNKCDFSLLGIIVAIALSGVALLCKELGITVLPVLACYDFVYVCDFDLPSFLWQLYGATYGFFPTNISSAGSDSNSGNSNCPGNDSVAGHTLAKVGGHAISQNTTKDSKKVPKAATVQTVVDEQSLKNAASDIRHTRVQVPLTEEAIACLKRVVILALGFLILSFLRLQMNHRAEGSFIEQTNPSIFMKNTLHRSLMKTYLAACHAWMLIFPYHLNADWAWGSIELIRSVWDPRNLGTALFLLTLACCLYLSLFRSRLMASTRKPFCMAVMWTVFPFLPSSGLLVPVGFVIAERILYMPSIGFCLFIAYGLNLHVHGDEQEPHVLPDEESKGNMQPQESHRLKHDASHMPQVARPAPPASMPMKSIVVLALVVVLVGAYSLRTIARNDDWDTEFALYKAGIKVAPKNAQLHYMYARQAKTIESKIKHFRIAALLEETYVEAFTNWGVSLTMAHRHAEAIKVYEDGVKAFSMRPNRLPPLVLLQFNLGLAHWGLGHLKEAEEYFKLCLRNDPMHPDCSARLQMIQEAKQS